MSPTLQALIRATANWLTRFLIYITALAAAFALLFGTPNIIKKTLVEADAYDRFVAAIIETNSNSKQAEGTLPLDDPEVQKILKKSFPAQDLQLKAEQVIDSFYIWLNGKSAAPAYRVDFTPNIELFADELSTYIVNRLAFLPPCVEPPANYSPFTAYCRPDPFDLQAEKKLLETEIRNNSGLLPKTVFTVQDLPSDKDGQTFVQKYSDAPTWFAIAKQAPIILAFATALCSLVVVWLSRSKRKSITQLGIAFVSNGVFLCLSPLVLLYVLPELTGSLSDGFNAKGMQALGTDVNQALYNRLNIWLLINGIVITIIGVGIILLERATRPRSRYANVKQKSGLISSIERRAANGRFKLDPAKVPLQSSEISVTKALKRKRDRKYRRIPRGEITRK